MRQSLYADEKAKAVGQTLVGAVLLIFGVKLLRSLFAYGAFVLAAFGAWVIARGASRLIRLVAVERDLLREAQADFRHEFRRSTLPRQLYWLLLAVAEVDGPVRAAERDRVRRFLAEALGGTVHEGELRGLDGARIPPEQTARLARGLREVLSPAERETVFFWACVVAFADGRFATQEHEILQRIAAGLGLAGDQARRVFWHAKDAHQRGGRAEDAGRRARGRRPGPAPEQSRRRALEILGLDEHADRSAIRRRHRELVKKFHPDRHSHLGETAARAAAERFRAVQEAYELLLSEA
jgi:DnaJ-domain-containing protein 1